MRSSTLDIFHDNKTAIIAEWISSLKTQISDRYTNRPKEEITATITEAYEAFIVLLSYNDFNRINSFIEKIARMRLTTGFPLSDVQMAFELFRSISIPLLAKHTTVNELEDAILCINHCMTYTIHRFSDLFQSMQQAKILQQNQHLEEQVLIRTTELKESEQRYKILVEEINDGFFVIHEEILVFVNPATGLMHGYEPSTMIGQKFFNFIDPGHRKKVMAAYYRSLETRKPLPMLEYQRITRNGQCYPTEIFSKATEWDGKLSVIVYAATSPPEFRWNKKFVNLKEWPTSAALRHRFPMRYAIPSQRC